MWSLGGWEQFIKSILGGGDTPSFASFFNISDVCFEQLYLTPHFGLGQSNSVWFSGIQFNADGKVSNKFTDLGQIQIGVSNRAWLQISGSRANSSGFCNASIQNLGFACQSNIGNKIEQDVINTGFLEGEQIKQVGGTRLTSFIITQTNIFSTNHGEYSENGIRTVVSDYWGKMLLPLNVKIILKVQFVRLNVIIVSQTGMFYANGYNHKNQLCIQSQQNQAEFQYFGKLKNLVFSDDVSFHVQLNNTVTFCGTLLNNSTPMLSYSPLNLDLPSNEIIDLQVMLTGLLGIFLIKSEKKLYYMGNYPYNDQGVIDTNVPWTPLTIPASNSNSFVMRNNANIALIYGCSRLQPFRFNGLCWENCSYQVVFKNGIEKCRNKENCSYLFSLPHEYPRNWSVCVECQHFRSVDDLLSCRQDCNTDQFTFLMQNDSFASFNNETEHMNISKTNGTSFTRAGNTFIEVCSFYNSSRSGFLCSNQVQCGQLTLIMSQNNFSCAADEHDDVFDLFRSNWIWSKDMSVYTLTASCPLTGCISNFCTNHCSSAFCASGNAFNFSGGFVCRNDSCLHPYNFMQRNQTLCDQQSCGGYQVKLDTQKVSCLYDLFYLQDFFQTNGSVWNQTASGVFEQVWECSVSGCIHRLVCTRSCVGSVCDNLLIPTYSNSGLTCKQGCSNWVLNDSNLTCQAANLSQSQETCNQKFFRLNSTFVICQQVPHCSLNQLQHVIATYSGFKCVKLTNCSIGLNDSCIVGLDSVDCNATFRINPLTLVCILHHLSLKPLDVGNFQQNESTTLCGVSEVSNVKCELKKQNTSIWENFETVPAEGRTFDLVSQQPIECEVVLEAQSCREECGWQFDVQNKRCIAVLIQDLVFYE